MPGEHPADAAEFGHQIGQESDRVRIAMGRSNPHRTIESPVNIPVTFLALYIKMESMTAL
jgi:hypothetical protein